MKNLQASTDHNNHFNTQTHQINSASINKSTSATQDPNSIKNKVQGEIKSSLNEVKKEGKNALESQKSGVANQFKGFAQATEEAAKNLDNNGEASWAAPYMHQAATQIDNISQSLQSKSINNIIDDTVNLARNNPTAFTIGSLILGVGIARFFKSSQQSQQNNHQASNTQIQNHQAHSANNQNDRFDPNPSNSHIPSRSRADIHYAR